MRLLIIGTHPSQTTGYSKVVYNIANELVNFPQIKCTIFGIQKFNNVNDDLRLGNLRSNVSIWDVYNYDSDDFGFGTKSLLNFICINDPDIIMIYNDAEVIKKYIMNIKLLKENYQYKYMLGKKNIKIVAYLDQVHKNQNPDTIQYIAENTEHVFCFTNNWKENYLSYFKKMSYDLYKNKTSVVRHGVDNITCSLSSEQCKIMYGFPKDSFIFLNLNRFASKKRLDISIIAFVNFLKKTNTKKAYLYFPAINDDKGFEILRNIYNYELKINGLEDFENNLIIGNKPISDFDIYNIYNASDVGLNSCDGEGFGLCNYEHASLGKPQIISKTGGLLDYFNDENSLLCETKYTSWSINNERSEVIDPLDMSNNMVKYFVQKSLYNKHSEKLKNLTSKYKWKYEVSNMINVLLNLTVF